MQKAAVEVYRLGDVPSVEELAEAIAAHGFRIGFGGAQREVPLLPALAVAVASPYGVWGSKGRSPGRTPGIMAARPPDVVR
jgi:hypothetical protein